MFIKFQKEGISCKDLEIDILNNSMKYIYIYINKSEVLNIMSK